MASMIESYGLLANTRGSALVSRDGSIDWLCMPRFDSDACMAALLGNDEHGTWRIQPSVAIGSVRRRYRPGTLIVETELECEGGTIRLIDFMPVKDGRHSVVRIVEGVSGEVPVWFNLAPRLGYGVSKPFVTQQGGAIRFVAAPDSLTLRSNTPMTPGKHEVTYSLRVKEGQRVWFELSWSAAHRDAPAPIDVEEELERTEAWWSDWSSRSTYDGPYQEAVNTSLLVLKAMTYGPTGGIAAAPTLGLPEALGGERNWDYRFCWLRDASLTMRAFLAGGYTEEAENLRAWLLRAAAGTPADLQIMYGLAGERRLTEFNVPWLPGYEDSRPVRVGNAAHDQFQLDTFGEVIGSFSQALSAGMGTEKTGYGFPALVGYMQHLAKVWQKPDDGIWEVRGGRRHFVHSKFMAWLAVDRFVERLENDPRGREYASLLPEFKVLRERIHREVCERGYNPRLGCFTQSYDSEAMDSSLLLMPFTGFLPFDDPRVLGTIREVEKQLLRNGFLLRYSTTATNDGLAGEEGAFLACSFWLVGSYAATGRLPEARALMDKLLALRNDLGLLAEEYDGNRKRLVGNFPQAYSHLALIQAAVTIGAASGPHRKTGAAKRGARRAVPARARRTRGQRAGRGQQRRKRASISSSSPV